MTSLDIINVSRFVLIVSFIALVCLSALNQIVGERRAAFRRKQDEEFNRILRRVDAVLVVWAETWGEPAEVVKERLLGAIRDA